MENEQQQKKRREMSESALENFNNFERPCMQELLCGTKFIIFRPNKAGYQLKRSLDANVYPIISATSLTSVCFVSE